MPSKTLPKSTKHLIPRVSLLLITLLCLTIPTSHTYASTNITIQVDHTLLKEPKYQSTPKYSLITLGDRGDVKVWMVEDGRRLFVDKNANGDLTDDGPPIEPTGERHLDKDSWDFQYVLEAITPTNGSRHTRFKLYRWNYGDKQDEYGLYLSVDGKLPMYAGWFGTFWAKDSQHAPVIHFGGPFKPKILRRKNFQIGEAHERLSLCFINPGSGPGAESRLSTNALPTNIVPELRIEWPSANGGAPIKTYHELKQRCCYWEFYTTAFELPAGIAPGQAKISIDFVAGTSSIELTTTELSLPVLGPNKLSLR